MNTKAIFPLPPHVARMADEKDQLDARREKLAQFLRGDDIASLPPEEQQRLHLKAKVMDMYSHILGDRIAAWMVSQAKADPADVALGCDEVRMIRAGGVASVRVHHQGKWVTLGPAGTAAVLRVHDVLSQ